MRRLSDGERDVIREQERDARETEEGLDVRPVTDSRYAGGRYDFPGVWVEDGVPMAGIRCRNCGHSEPRRFPLPIDNGCNRCQQFTSDVLIDDVE